MVIYDLYLNPVYVFLVPFLIGVLILANPLISFLSKKLLIQSRKRYFGRKKPKEVEPVRFEDLPLIRDLGRYMDLAGFKISPFYIILFSLFIGIAFFFLTRMIMKSFINNTIIAVIFSSIPFLIVWQKYQITRQRISKIMIPTVQNFTGFLAETDNITNSIHRAAHQMPFEIQREWTRLCNNINTGIPLQDALIEFAERIRNEWADAFVDILITKIETGTKITPLLFKLVNEMQNESFNEDKRITVMAIYRWGIFVMIILSVIIVVANIYLDPINYKYYFEDPFGKNFVTFSCVVMFASFIGALLMGRRSI